jgi:hypothetical protein
VRQWPGAVIPIAAEIPAVLSSGGRAASGRPVVDERRRTR